MSCIRKQQQSIIALLMGAGFVKLWGMKLRGEYRDCE